MVFAGWKFCKQGLYLLEGNCCLKVWVVMGKDRKFYVPLDISAEQFKNYYSQNIKSIVATSHDGRRVQFPASVLQAYVTHNGVQGTFCLTVDSNSRFKSISRVNE